MATRCKLGKLGAPLLGQRQLASGRVGWDVTSLEFRLRAFGLPAKRVDGRFDAATKAALATIPASPRADTGWNRRREDLPRARAGRVVHDDRRAGGDRASRSTGGGLQHDRAPLRREAGVARTGKRPHPAEHASSRGSGCACPARSARAPSRLRSGVRRLRRRSCTPCSRVRGSSRSPSGTASAPTVLANANGLDLDERHRPGSAAAHSGPPRDGRGGTFVREPGAASPSHGRGRRELLLHLAALPRQPVAARAGERHVA